MISNGRRCKVLIVSHTYVVEANRAKISAIARRNGFEIMLLTPRKWKDTLADSEYRGETAEGYVIESSWVAFSGHALRAIYDPLKLLGILKTFRPDIVHVEEEPGGLALFQFALLKPLFGYKLVFFTWENIYKKMKLSLIEKLPLRRSDYAIAGNSEAVEVLRRKDYKGRTKVIPQLGVDLSEVNSATVLLKKEQLGLDGFTVGFIGRLVAEKGVFTLVDALANQITNCKLLMVGTGPAKSDLLESAKIKGIQDRIVFSGAVPHERVVDFLACMDVLVLPSQTTPEWKEQFGHVLIEAMALGIPVIGSNSGAIPEVIGDAGLLFEEGRADHLCDCIVRLEVDGALRQELSELGRERVSAVYTHERIAEHTAEVYRALVEYGVAGEPTHGVSV